MKSFFVFALLSLAASEECTADETTMLQGKMDVRATDDTEALLEEEDELAAEDEEDMMTFDEDATIGHFQCYGTHEAEAATLSGAVVHANTASANHQGFTGQSFVDYLRPNGDYVEWDLRSCRAGSVTVTFRYALAGGNRPLTLSVNGGGAQRVAFGPTGSWRSWGETTATVTLRAGRNRVRLVAAGSSGANMDSMTVSAPQGEGHYIGCFTDNRARDMGRWLGDRNNAATNTFASCAAACNKAFFSLQSGGECFCSDTYANAGYSARPDSECGPVPHINANCASNSHSCGGHWRNAVYRNYHMTEGGARTCDSGTPLADNVCNAAVTQLASAVSQTPRRGLQRGSGGRCRDGGWGQVPTGCSAQSGGDWAAHFKTGPSGTDANCVHEAYQLVCTGV